MLSRTWSLLLLAAAALACDAGSTVPPVDAPPPAPAAAQDDPAVARVGDVEISQSELDAYIREELFQRETRGGNAGRVYDLRRRYLTQMVDERVVKAEAGRRGLEPEEMLRAEFATIEVSDDDVKAFYDQNAERMGGKPFEEVKDRLREYLQYQEQPAVMASLREGAGAEILLEPARFDVAADGPAKGPADARVTIVEFSDFQCPYCERATSVIAEISERYPEDVRIVYRHLPLDNIHPRARPAAEASACAQDQDRFWDYHDKLFAGRRALEDADLARYAQEIGLDTEAFQACLADGRFREKVEADASAAEAIGITGTPAFLVNGILLTGVRPIEEFVALIDGELAREQPAASLSPDDPTAPGS